MLLTAVGLFFAALAFALFFTRKVRDVAVRHNLATGPVQQHHVHTNPVPRFGGVAVYGTFLSITLLFLSFSRLFRFNLGFPARNILWILVPATLVFAIGVIDDIWSVS